MAENVNDEVTVGGGHPETVNSWYNEQANSMLGSSVVEEESDAVNVEDWTLSKLVGLALVMVRKVVFG